MRTTGTVKWFDPVKGDGCIVSDGGAQAALPPATLAAAGLHTIAPGTPLTCEVKLTNAALTVTAIYDIDGKPPRATPRAPDTRRDRGTVKWFDPAKGFGFIASNAAAGDVLIHRSVLDEFGGRAVVEGASIDCDVIEKIRGLQTRRPRRPRRARELIEEPTGPWVEAVCRWFSRPKGYGFVVVDGGTEEVFVHMDTLRQHNVRELRAGQRVRVRVARTDRGLMATAIAVAPAPRPHPATPARERTAGERKTGVIGALLSIDEAHGFGLVDLPDLDAIAIADIALLRAAGLLDPHARNCRLICDIEFAPPLIHIRRLTRLH